MERRFKMVKEFCGHGVGTIFHTAPCVQHTRNNVRDKMLPWQTFTIEPILCDAALLAVPSMSAALPAIVHPVTVWPGAKAGVHIAF